MAALSIFIAVSRPGVVQEAGIYDNSTSKSYIFLFFIWISKMSTSRQIPRDAQVIQAILKDMGITEYEPRVVNQLLEFVYRTI